MKEFLKKFQPSKEEQAFRDGNKEGFDVKAVHGVTGSHIAVDKMQTPYKYNGADVTVSGNVAIKDAGKRELIDVSYQCDGVSDKTLGRGSVLTDKAGNQVPFEQIDKKVKSYMVGATSHPFVVDYEFYKTVKDEQMAKFGFDSVGFDSYERYLDTIAEKMRSKDFVFIGSIKDLPSLREYRKSETKAYRKAHPEEMLENEEQDSCDF